MSSCFTNPTTTTFLPFSHCLHSPLSSHVYPSIEGTIMSQHSSRQKEYTDEGGVIIFNIGIQTRQQSSVDDGRKVIDQFIDLLRGYADDPNVTIESAHYEPATATIFIHDPTEKIEPIQQQL